MHTPPICHCGRNLCVARIELFKNLSIPLQEEIVRRTVHFDADAGEVLINAGDPAEYLLVIREGKVKRNLFDADGKEYIMDILVDGEFIGEEDFLNVGRFHYNAVCVAPSKLCKVSKTMLMEIIREREDSMPLAIALIEHMSQRLNQADARITLLMEDNALRRVVGFLLERVDRVEGDVLELTLDDIAGSANLRRETVSRKLRELQKQGLIERRGQRNIFVPNRQKLAETLKEI
ncbi:MAG: Crp/Fnr family transcriptional regulator [Fastidiosipilaceae bacterium]